LFGLQLSDTQTGIKLFKREVLSASIPRVKNSRFAFDLELLISVDRLGGQIIECPVEATYSRTGQVGRMRFKHMRQMFGDLIAIYYRASFWRWLQPGLGVKLWMLTFVAGIFLLGIGIGKLVTALIPPSAFKPVIYILALQFIPNFWRNILLIIIGFILITVSFIQLNKSLLNAFTRRDRGDLAGLFRRK
jgi:cellulose synthase/poly-beta-1,6-N-acetylglucosamine synthase-like glycosyltransferase